MKILYIAIINTILIKTFQKNLLTWYAAHGRVLPWRTNSDPYHILVSEIMLQQTQVDRVLPKYKEFLSRFPTVESLASAPKADVLRIWSGLGYNSRALRLQHTAQVVLRDYGGVFPRTREALRALPGIGPYTSGAIMAFAFHEPVSFVDTNIKRVLHRVFFGLEFDGWKKTDKEIASFAEEVCPMEQSFAYHQALMDVGALFCTARKPQCAQCPLASACVTATMLARQPDLLQSPRASYKKSTVPFKQSKRYIRGGIVEKLRIQHEMSLDALYAYVQEVLRPTDQQEFEDILGDLVREGLLTREGEFVRLG